MTDKTDSKEREAFIRWHMDYLHTDEMLAAHVWDNEHRVAAAFQAGRASLAADAGSEPVKRVFLVHTGEEHEGEATYTRHDDAPPPLCDSECLYTHPSPPEGMVMVPKEPTEAMKTAAVKYANGSAVYKNVKADVLRIEEGIYGEVYEAMIAAAPPTSSADSRKGE